MGKAGGRPAGWSTNEPAAADPWRRGGARRPMTASHLTDLATLRQVDPAALAGHSPGTVRVDSRLPRGVSRRAGDRQSSALRPVKRLFTLKESGIYLGISYGKVRDWVARGLLPSIRLPGG